jgi:hypothetical protein
MTIPKAPWAVVPDAKLPFDLRVVAQGQCLAKVYGSDAKPNEDLAELLRAAPDLLAALEWAFAKIGRPVRRLAQNEAHYDRYYEVEALIKGAGGKV